MSEDNKKEEKKKRGFACLTPEQRKEVAKQGGIAAHQKGTGRQWTREEAIEAGRKGGQSISKDKNHMSEIGSKGGRPRIKGEK